MCLHPDRLDVVLLRGLQVGVAEQIRGNADLLRRAVDKLGHRAIPEQVWPNMLAEGVPGAGFDMLPDRRAAHRPTRAVEPEVAPDTAHLAVAACN